MPSPGVASNGYTLLPNVVQVVRQALLEVFPDDVRMVKAGGLPERTALLEHTLKNTLVPVSAVLGLIATVLRLGRCATL